MILKECVNSSMTLLSTGVFGTPRDINARGWKYCHMPSPHGESKPGLRINSLCGIPSAAYSSVRNSQETECSRSSNRLGEWDLCLSYCVIV